MSKMTLAIIGTAGRKEDASKLSKDTFVAMCKATKEVLSRHTFSSAVSGGAAWADHIAVRLYLKDMIPNLTLYLPCEWDKKKKKFKDTGEVNFKTNPGGTANFYHKKFSEAISIDSLQDIHAAIKKGAKIEYGKGFFQRNTQVAIEADVVLAMTFGNGAYIKDGGTADTVKKYFSRHDINHIAYHLDLNSLQLYNDIILI